MPSYKNLFLRQSYLDCYDEYEKSLKNDDYVKWDYVILTASNEAQAMSYRQQIEYRVTNELLPESTHYAVLPDPDGKRVGSGGATLNVMRYIKSREESFTGKRILVIHSGGDSKRVPQYSACGKLFSPVPRMLKSGRRSTLFDEFIIGLSGVPGRITDGMLVCSGDVLLLFNPLQIDFYSKGAAALSIKENVQTGKNHGVFLEDIEGNVGHFLHKQSVDILKEKGAVDKSGNVNIDTGAVIFDSNILNDLYTLVDTDVKFKSAVNEKVRLSFYADFLYPLASGSTLENFYYEPPEGDFSKELKEKRSQIWEKLHKYKMKLIRFSPASFIHFGTTHELLSLMTEEMDNYKFLEWKSNINTNSKSTLFASSNSYISRNAMVKKGSYIEDSFIHSGTVIGEKCVVSGVTLRNATVPDNTVIHGLKLSDGRFTARMYGVDDNPKECKLMGKDIGEPLWTAQLYPICNSMEEAVEKILNNLPCDEKISLKDSFNNADVTQILPWQSKLDDKVKVESFIEAIDNGVSAENAIVIFRNGLSQRAKNMLIEEAEKLSDNVIEEFSKKIRIYYYLSKITSKEILLDKCFKTICDSVLNASIDGAKYDSTLHIAKDKVITRLPVRVNWGGGWSDTPPYCNEHGGVVLNAAITLDNNYPIEVVLKKIPDKKIVFASADNGSYGEFNNISDIQNCRDPHDAFALHKAALIACGIVPYDKKITIDELISHLGSGFYLSTQVINIPRGSGLGTSSILAGACIKGIFEFLGKDISDDELYNRVLCMEQIMSIGGGWQDQVGGLSKGIKMVSADSGLKQTVKCTPVIISDETLSELDERFAIIYTGQRRLARNLLREVVGKYVGNNPDSLRVLYEIQRVAVLMRFELEKGNINGFAELLNEHWELSKQLDKGCTNTCIDQIFVSIEDLIDGKMICGAGGGGFLQVVLKKGITVDILSDRLNSVFADSGVDVWKCNFCM